MGILEDKDMECLFGDTPDALKQSLRKSQVKGSVEDVTLALLECKHAGTWEHKHLPIESKWWHHKGYSHATSLL